MFQLNNKDLQILLIFGAMALFGMIVWLIKHKKIGGKCIGCPGGCHCSAKDGKTSNCHACSHCGAQDGIEESEETSEAALETELSYDKE